MALESKNRGFGPSRVDPGGFGLGKETCIRVLVLESGGGERL